MPQDPSSEWKWLESTRALQINSYDTDPWALEPTELADYVTMNHTALVVELSEFMAEVGWKNWAKPRGWVNREQAVGELVDVAHFLANLATAMRITDEEWVERYRAKQAVNAVRQEEGYDGITGKCRACKRDLAEVTVTPVFVAEQKAPVGYYCACGASVVMKDGVDGQ